MEFVRLFGDCLIGEGVGQVPRPGLAVFLRRDRHDVALCNGLSGDLLQQVLRALAEVELGLDTRRDVDVRHELRRRLDIAGRVGALPDQREARQGGGVDRRDQHVGLGAVLLLRDGDVQHGDRQAHHGGHDDEDPSLANRFQIALQAEFFLGRLAPISGFGRFGGCDRFRRQALHPSQRADIVTGAAGVDGQAVAPACAGLGLSTSSRCQSSSIIRPQSCIPWSRVPARWSSRSPRTPSSRK